MIPILFLMLFGQSGNNIGNQGKVKIDGIVYTVILDGGSSGGGGTVNGTTVFIVSDGGSKIPTTLVDVNDSGIVFDYEGRVDTSQDSLLLDDNMDNSGVDWRKWTNDSTGWSISQASSIMQLNNGGNTNTGSAQITSKKRFSPYHEAYVYAHARIRFRNFPVVNGIADLGFGTASSTSPISDGAILRFSGTSVSCVANAGGTERTTSMAAITTNVWYRVKVSWNSEQVNCSIREDSSSFSSTATVFVGTAAAGTSNAGRQPFFMRIYHNTTINPAIFFDVAQLSIFQKQLDQNVTLENAIAAQGGHSINHPTPTNSIGQTGGWCNSNSATRNVRTSVGGSCNAIASCTLSNTTPCGSTLGGFVQWAAVTPGTDAVLLSYQVPTNFQLAITRIRVSCINLGADNNNLTATGMMFFAGLNSTGDSLAVAENQTSLTQEPRVTILGYTSIEQNKPVGYTTPEVIADFFPPLVIDPLKRFQLGVKVVSGVATASQIIRCHFSPTGYFLP